MKHIEDAVKDYLEERNSSYAILLTGKWGIGKTHYYKTKLVPLINSINNFEDNSKKYKAVYVSLFGLKSIKDVQVEIFWALNNVLSDNKTRKVGALLKSMAGGLTKSLTGISTKVESIVELIQNSAIDYKDIVLCFDDLERRHSSLSFEEITGYINNLTEHEKAKVLIIANEDKIDEGNYKSIKEKVIHDTLLFEPDWKTQVESFIKYHYGENSAFGEFLLNRLEDIVKLSEDANCNLRTLDFTLKKVQKIYCQLEAKNYSFSNSAVEKAVYQFAIITCVQYKIEAIDFNHRSVLSRIFSSTRTLEEIREAGLNPGKSPYGENESNFHSKVLLLTRKAIFVDSIFCFITGKFPINLKLLEMEIEQLNSVIPNPMLPQNKLLKKLQYTSILDFSDKEYYSLHKRILEHAKKGEYLLWEYPTIFYLLMEYGDQLYDYEASEIVKQLEIGMSKAPITRHLYSPGVTPFDKESLKYFKYIAQYKKLKSFVDKKHEENKRKKKEEKIKEFCQSFTKEWESKMEQLRRGEFRDTFFDKDFAQTVYQTALSSQKFIKQLFSFFKDTDIYKYNKEAVLKEIDFLKELTKKLSHYLNANSNNDIKHLTLGVLLKNREERIRNLQTYLQNNPIFHDTPPST